MEKKVNKRRFLAALSAVLLISAALVTSCMNQLGDYEDKQEVTVIKEAPVGKGLVRIKVVDPDARTILPDVLPLSSMYYSVECTGVSHSGGIGLSTAVAFSALNNKAFPLDPDTYTVVITAWKEAGKINPLAGWDDTGVVVPAGGTKAIDVNLKGWIDDGFDTYTGSFTYAITLPAYPTTAGTAWTVTTPPVAYTTSKIDIIGPYPDTTTVAATSSLPTAGAVNNSGSPISLTAGYYKVKITISAANCQDRIVSSAMHIYNATTTNYTYTVPGLDQNTFSVRFNTNDIADSSATFPLTTPNIANAATVSDPGNPSNAGYIFGGWFTAGSGSGAVPDSATQWNFASSKVFKDTTLYAKWTAKTAVAIDFTAIPGVTPPVAGQAPVTTPIAATQTTDQYTGTISWTGSPSVFGANTAYTATITLTAEPGYTFNGVAQDIFTVAGAPGANVTNPTGSGNTCVVTAVFPNTDRTITIAAIPGVAKPLTGASPVVAITPTDQYTGTIEWDDDDDPFEAGKTYEATITLTAKPGYTLYGVPANFFTVANATSYANSINSGIVTAEFPETGPVGIEATITFDITDIAAGDIVRTGTATDPITYGDIAGSKTLIYTLDSKYDNVIWTIDGATFGTGNSVTISAANTTFLSKLVSGTRLIVVEGDDEDGIYWSRTISITVSNN